KAGAALAALNALAQNNFGDPAEAADEAAHEVGATAQGAERLALTASDAQAYIQGLPASPGLALGAARTFRAAAPEVPTHLADDPLAEWRKLQQALEATRGAKAAAGELVARRSGGETAAIFEAHALFLKDEALLGPARRLIFTDR